MQVTRLTGSYYTSQRIADYMAAWALRDRSDTLLEPAFGDGVFLDAAFNRFSRLATIRPRSSALSCSLLFSEICRLRTDVICRLLQRLHGML